MLREIGSSDIRKIFAGLAAKGLSDAPLLGEGPLQADILSLHVFPPTPEDLPGSWHRVSINKFDENNFAVEINSGIGSMVGGATEFQMVRQGDDIVLEGDGIATERN